MAIDNAECGMGVSKERIARYRRDVLIAGALYAVTVLASVSAIKLLAPPSWVAAIIAFTPVAPMLLMLRAYLAFMDGVDELQRRIQQEAMLAGAAVVTFGSFGYGFVEGAADVPHLPAMLILPAWIGISAVARVFVARRYQ